MTAETIVALPDTDPTVADLERRLASRAALRHRHSQSLSRLMSERADLQGVHALADFVTDSVRWTA